MKEFEDTIGDCKCMEDQKISIRVTTRYERARIWKIPIPFKRVEISNATYSFSNGDSSGNESPCNPLECLVELLVDAELNRQGKQISPIHATFELPGESRQYGPLMEKILEMYARSEGTSVSFEYEE